VRKRRRGVVLDRSSSSAEILFGRPSRATAHLAGRRRPGNADRARLHDAGARLRAACVRFWRAVVVGPAGFVALRHWAQLSIWRG